MNWLQAASYIATALGMIGLIWAIHKNREDTKFKKTEKSLEFIHEFLNEILPKIKNIKKQYKNEYKKQETMLFNNLNIKYSKKYRNVSKNIREKIIKDFLATDDTMKDLLSVSTKLALKYDEVIYKLNVESIYVKKKMVTNSIVYPISQKCFIDFYDDNQDVIKQIQGDVMSLKTLKRVNKKFKKKRFFYNLRIKMTFWK